LPPGNRNVVCLAVVAGVIAITSGLLATRGNSAIVGNAVPITIAAAPIDSLDELKSQYRRPTSIPFPKDNPYSTEKVLLGRKLYFDTRLSAANVLSCATCHNPAFAWGDGQPKGVGHGMITLGRRSPSIINVAFGQIFMWDGRAPSLEAQALGPITAPVEMNLPVDHLIERLKAISEYGLLFQFAFPKDGLTPESIAKAIATYERTVVSGRAPFDLWVDGNENAISEPAKRGFALFNGKAMCAKCHSGWNFTDDSFHDTGLPDADIGRGKFVPGVIKMAHAFKTPGLREVARRGPYMHDGSLPTLAAVVDHYSSGGIDRPSRSDQVNPLNLSQQEKDDIISFLRTITGEMVRTVIPVLPR
jgi:cytochrome c peroxidase